jgi:FixJ family two-component response regulator
VGFATAAWLEPYCRINKRIATELHIREKTVKIHRAHVIKKT